MHTCIIYIYIYIYEYHCHCWDEMFSTLFAVGFQVQSCSFFWIIESETYLWSRVEAQMTGATIGFHGGKPFPNSFRQRRCLTAAFSYQRFSEGGRMEDFMVLTFQISMSTWGALQFPHVPWQEQAHNNLRPTCSIGCFSPSCGSGWCLVSTWKLSNFTVLPWTS